MDVGELEMYFLYLECGTGNGPWVKVKMIGDKINWISLGKLSRFLGEEIYQYNFMRISW